MNLPFSDIELTWPLALFLLFTLPIMKWVITLVYEFGKQLIPTTNLLNKYCRKDVESWAVVTGATDGIGLGFCEVLVSMGFNLVLISRNPQKLQTTVDSLQKLKPVNNSGKIKTISFNFKDSADPIKYGNLISELKTLDIGLFVNNVGTSDVGLFHTFSHEKIVDFININCVSMAILSADILALMKVRPHKSALINLSSYMEQNPLPFLSLYSATKAFNKNLTEGLWYQYPQIDVMCLKPLFVETPLSKQKKGFGIPDRRQCAQDSLRELRWEHQTYGYISHRIIGSISRHLVPEWLYHFGVKKVTKLFLKKSFPKAKIN